jgi:hypothetical protein
VNALAAQVADRWTGAYWALRTRCIRGGEQLLERAGRGETQQRVELDTLGLGHPDRVDYIPSGWLFLRRALRGRRVGASDVFVDFGSGKGRVLCQAARYPFGRVLGVEIADDLSRVARANIQRSLPRLRCRDLEVVTCDATKFPIPDDMTYAYFFNPFGAETFRRVLANIIESLERHPRDLTLIYANPKMTECIDQSGRFALISQRHGRREWDSIAVYRSI